MGDVNISVVPFTKGNINDIPGRLRALADSIEAGDYAAVQGLAWATVEESTGKVGAVGLLGVSHGRVYAAGVLQAAAFKLLHEGTSHG